MRWAGALLCACQAVSASAQASWPQWRGPERDGRAASLPGPEAWPGQLELAWRVEVGEGHASPVSSGERVFVFARSGEAERVASLGLGDGSEVWTSGYPAPYEMHPAARAHGPGPKATPALSGGRLFTLGIGGVLSCFDAATGERRWQRDFAGEFARTSPTYGAAASPLATGGLLVAAVGGAGDGAIVALDPATGRERWSWRGDGPGYASPVATELDGVAQVVTQTETLIVALALADGRLLWKAPLRTPYDQNAVTPVVAGDTVVYSGLDQGVRAVRPRRDDGEWRLHEVWSLEEASAYMSTPVVVGETLFGLSHRRRGQYFAVDVSTGELLWTSPGRQAENAALLGGETVVALTDSAELLVLRADRGRFDPVATYAVAESDTWAHPAPVPGGLLVKDASSVALWRWR